MSKDKFTVIIILIILIITTVLILKITDIPRILIIISVGAAILFGYIFNFNELFTSYHIDDTDYDYSKYDNISLSDDADMTMQEVPVNFGNNTYDNLDVIESSITRGTSLFPSEQVGFSTLEGDPDMLNRYQNIALSGQQNIDELLARKQAQRSTMQKRSLDGAVQATKNLYSKYFTEELNENENREWWSSEASEIETDFTPY